MAGSAMGYSDFYKKKNIGTPEVDSNIDDNKEENDSSPKTMVSKATGSFAAKAKDARNKALRRRLQMTKRNS
jgi:hypothetical protein